VPGFLGEFIAYLKRRTDCPADFHIHAGMAALAAALGNRVWCDGWARAISPNLWIVILAPSGCVGRTKTNSHFDTAELTARILGRCPAVPV